MRAAYQLLPPLTSDEYEVLKADIATRGIQIPIEFDEAGNVLDGHHRLRIAQELGCGYPRIVRHGLSEAQKIDHCLALNLARRHLNDEQRAALHATLREMGRSLRSIASTTGVSPQTVMRDLSTVPNGTVDFPDRVIGLDGKARPATWSLSTIEAGRECSRPKSHAESWTERRETIAAAVRSRPVGPDAEFYGRIVQSDALTYLRERETAKTDLCITSPPYWAKRTYGAGEDELGQEARPLDYLTKLRTIIAEIKRVLRPTGWLLLNVGDTLASQPGRYRGDPDRARGVSDKVRDAASGALDHRQWDVPDKSLCLIPWRLLSALVLEDGWRCRNVIAWHKVGHQPENVGDRLTQAWEPVFALTPGEYPYYDRDALIDDRPVDVWRIPVGRNGDGGRHPAVFPDQLVERAIRLACPLAGVVLDPFAGSGTVLHVATQLGREFLGCDLVDWGAP